jgi:Xaa-Pro aminopeptidase
MGSTTTGGWLTRPEAAARLGIGLRTLDWQRARGQHRPLIHFVRVGGRLRLLYSERELARYIKRQARRDAEAHDRFISAIRRAQQERLLAQEIGIRQTLRAVAA